MLRGMEPRDGGTRAASWLDAFFELAGRGTTVRREVLAGATTFVTMAYVRISSPRR